MKLLRGIIGLGEMVLLVVTVINIWNTQFHSLAIAWLVYLVICLCLAFYETGKDSRSK